MQEMMIGAAKRKKDEQDVEIKPLVDVTLEVACFELATTKLGPIEDFSSETESIHPHHGLPKITVYLVGLCRSGVYLGTHPAPIGASLGSTEEPRCLHFDAI